jgi:hypothetical protein
MPFMVFMRYIAYFFTTGPFDDVNLKELFGTGLNCYRDIKANPSSDATSTENVQRYYLGLPTPGLIDCFPNNLLIPIPYIPLLDFDFYKDFIGAWLCVNRLVPTQDEINTNNIPTKPNCVCDMYPTPTQLGDLNTKWSILGHAFIPAQLYSWYKTLMLLILLTLWSPLTTSIDFVWYSGTQTLCFLINLLSMFYTQGLCPNELFNVWNIRFQMNGYTIDQCWSCIVQHIGSFSKVSMIYLVILYITMKMFYLPLNKFLKRIWGIFILRPFYNMFDVMSIRAQLNRVISISPEDDERIQKEVRQRRRMREDKIKREMLKEEINKRNNKHNENNILRRRQNINIYNV